MKPPMSFDSTGLPKQDSIEKAYYQALQSHVQRYDEELKMAHQSIDGQLKQRLEMAKQTGQYSSEQLKQMEEEQKRAGAVFKRQVEQQMQETRDIDFITRVVEPARILSESDTINEGTINAILLMETIRSPKDYDKIKADFGSDVSDVIADILDLEAYPSEQDTKLQSLSDNAKLANLAMIVGNLKSFIDIGKSLPQGQKLVLAAGQDGAKKKIEFASAIRGLDTKLDDMFVDVFNEVSKFVDTGFKVEVDQDTNTLKAVPFENKPKGPDNDGPAIGGGFFGNDNDTPSSGNFGGGPKTGGPKIGGGF